MNDISEILNKLTFEAGIYHNQAIAILKSFFSDFSDARKLFDIYAENRDFLAIQKQAHQLRGTTANLRLSHISTIATLLESSAKECNVDRCESNMIRISNEVNDLRLQMSSINCEHKLKTLIVEDNIASGRVLEQIIVNLGHISLGIVSSADQALLSVKNSLPDMVFMDIDLSTEMNGIYTAELLSGYHSIPVVFVSIHADENIIKIAKQYGVGYVVKPFSQKEIEEMIRIASENLIRGQSGYRAKQTKLKIKDANQIYFLDLKDVIYFEARAHTIIIHTSTKTYQLSSSLKEIKRLDTHNSFIQPHRSFLVNRAYITALINENYHYHLKMKSKSAHIPVSNSNVKKIKLLQVT